MRAIIFANGDLSYPETARNHVRSEDLLIAADGGARHCLALDLLPNVVIGDFDSLTETDLAAFKRAGSELIRYPTRKDYTDLELALMHAKERGADEIIILGAVGGRWDQTLANLLLPAAEFLANIPVRILDGPQEIRLIHAGETLVANGSPGDTVSLVPLGGDARGITTEGLEYPLKQGALLFGGTMGISNVLVGSSASIALEEGILLCVLIHKEEPG